MQLQSQSPPPPSHTPLTFLPTHALNTGATYNGMAKGAKLAFFDIGDIHNELYVPDDLAKYLYPTSYSGNA